MKDECLKRPNVKPVSVAIIVYSFVPSLHLQLLQKCNTQVISFLKQLAPLVLLTSSVNIVHTYKYCERFCLCAWNDYFCLRPMFAPEIICERMMFCLLFNFAFPHCCFFYFSFAAAILSFEFYFSFMPGKHFIHCSILIQYFFVIFFLNKSQFLGVIQLFFDLRN